MAAFRDGDSGAFEEFQPQVFAFCYRRARGFGAPCGVAGLRKWALGVGTALPELAIEAEFVKREGVEFGAVGAAPEALVTIGVLRIVGPRAQGATDAGDANGRIDAVKLRIVGSSIEWCRVGTIAAGTRLDGGFAARSSSCLATLRWRSSGSPATLRNGPAVGDWPIAGRAVSSRSSARRNYHNEEDRVEDALHGRHSEIVEELEKFTRH